MRDTAGPQRMLASVHEAFGFLKREYDALWAAVSAGADAWDAAALVAAMARDGARARLRNWRFYDAPIAAIVCMHRELHHVDSLDVGMFLQTFLLALTARRLRSCVQILIARFPDVIHETLNIP